MNYKEAAKILTSQGYKLKSVPDPDYQQHGFIYDILSGNTASIKYIVIEGCKNPIIYAEQWSQY